MWTPPLAQYAPADRWPLSMVYRREGRRLLAYERAVATQAHCSYFVTPNETALFVSQAPELAAASNPWAMVDCDFFKPDAQLANPFDQGEQALVFNGAMDYWPNIDGVSWFVADMLLRLLARHPGLRFYIVGRSPSPQVKALAGANVVVTGTVPDVRPYLQHASAVVAPLRVARGIQNKILEAMAMQQPVVTVSSCADAIGATAGQGLSRADTAEESAQLRCWNCCSRPPTGLRWASVPGITSSKNGWQAHLKKIDHTWPGHACAASRQRKLHRNRHRMTDSI